MFICLSLSSFCFYKTESTGRFYQIIHEVRKEEVPVEIPVTLRIKPFLILRVLLISAIVINGQKYPIGVLFNIV